MGVWICQYAYTLIKFASCKVTTGHSETGSSTQLLKLTVVQQVGASFSSSFRNTRNYLSSTVYLDIEIV